MKFGVHLNEISKMGLHLGTLNFWGGKYGGQIRGLATMTSAKSSFVKAPKNVCGSK